MAATLRTAQAAIERAIAKAEALSIPVCAVVVDGAGHVVASARRDGVPRVVFDLARRKAATAASFGAPLSAFVENVGGDRVLTEGLNTSPDLILLPGATPLPGGGAIGIGGGHYTQDQEISDHAAAL